MRNKANDYVDQERLIKDLTEYRKQYYEALNNGLPKPKLSEYAGECILKIGQGFARKPNWAGYTYIDDMISDGVLNAIQYIHNYDPNKSKYAFAYITKIMYWAFLTRLQKEKKLSKLKQRIMRECSAEFENDPELRITGSHNVDMDDSFIDNYMNRDGLYAKPSIDFTNEHWYEAEEGSLNEDSDNK